MLWRKSEALWVAECESLCHDVCGVRAAVYKPITPPVVSCCLSCCARTCKKVQNKITRIGMYPYDAVQDGKRFLGWVACSFSPIRRNNGLPPHICWRLAPCCLFWPHKPRRHVWDSVDGFIVERIVARVFHIPE